MISIKTCTIVYGYTDNCLDNIDDQDSPILIIEPRNEFIDKIRSLKNQRFTPLGCKSIGIRIFICVAKIQFI